MPATVASGHVLINLGPGQTAYVNLIYAGPGFFSCPCSDLALPPGAPLAGTWTSCPFDPAAPVLPPPLPLTEGQYYIAINHDPGTCAVPRGATPMDIVVRSEAFGPDMYSFTLGKTGSPVTCDIVVIIQDVGGGGAATGTDTGAHGVLAALSEMLLQNQKVILKVDLADIVRKLRRFYKPHPPEPPVDAEIK